MSMNRRTLALVAAPIAAAAVFTSAQLTSASAAPLPASAKVKPAVTMTLGTPAPHSPLQIGGRAETFTVTATNNTGKPQAFEPVITASAQGFLPLLRSDVKLAAVPVHAPATQFVYGVQDGQAMGGILPKGGRLYHSAFSIPAHHTYTWKVSVAAGSTWQRNNNSLEFAMYNQASDAAGSRAQVLDFKVGKARTGGRIFLSFSGATKLTLGKFADVDITLTNRSGAPLNLRINEVLNFSAGTQVGQVFKWGRASADIQVRENGHWVTLGKNQVLPALSGLANGASHTFQLRVRLTGYQTTLKGGTSRFIIGDVAWNATRGVVAMQGESLAIAQS